MLTQEYLYKYLQYDPSSGDFYWKEYRNKEGTVAGALRRNGYLVIQFKNKQYLAHRLAWFYTHGYFPENFIDHINGVKTDNRLENLRETSNQCNQRNSGNCITNTSGVRGVLFSNGYWISRITVNRKTKHLCCSKDFAEAVAHRLAAEQALDWDFCRDETSALRYIKRYCENINRF